jgi:hypothetical protein
MQISSEATAGDSAGIAWDTPIPFDEVPVSPFPVEVFPSWLQDFVTREAIATQTPVDLASMLSLAALSTACAGRFAVRLRSGHEEPLNLFVVVVQPSGTRKSAVFRDVTSPLEAFEAEEAIRLREPNASARQQRRILEARLKQIEDRAAREPSNKRADILAQAQSIRRELDSISVPAFPRLIADDCSPEKLASLLYEQSGRIALLSPEGDVFDLIAGRYSKNGVPNFGVYLKGHAGDALRVDRVGRPPEYVSRPALTLALTVQPDVLRDLMARPGFRERGLLARILFSTPRSLLGFRDVDAPPVPEAVKATYESGVRTLLGLPLETDADGRPTPRTLRLDDEARAVLRDFALWLEPKLSPFGELANITDWAGKLVGAVGRIAGLLHLADHAEHQAPWSTPIGRNCAARAVKFGEYLLQHAQAAFAQMGGDGEVEDAKRLLGWIQRSGQPRFTKRQIYQGTKGHFRTVAAMEPALRVLADARYIRPMPPEPKPSVGRPPSPTFEVNPNLGSHITHNPQIREVEPLTANCGSSGNSGIQRGPGDHSGN